MASKQGGKGKVSSPSRQASHKRGPARTETNRAKKIARHARRMGLDKAQIARATLPGEFPRVPLRRPAEGVIFLSPLRANWAGLPLHIVTVAGVVTEISPKQSDAINAMNDAFSRLEARHEILNPLSGRRTLVSARASN